jgi:formate-dependent nitrite reductase membrane component NrfD
MLVNTSPGDAGLNFKAESPMSVGVWALSVFSIFAFVSFVDALVRDGKIRNRLGRSLTGFLEGRVGKVWNVVGATLYLFIAGYTGVLLAVSNQPVWSDTWALGGLFLASGLSGSAALLLLLAHYRRSAEPSRGFLEIGGRLFAALELLLFVVFVLTLIGDGTLDTAFDFPWLLLWLVALAGMLPALRGLVTNGFNVTAERAIAAGRVQAWAVAPGLALIGVLALRAAVIFSAQA